MLDTDDDDSDDQDERPRGVPWPNGRLPLLDKPARAASEGEQRALKRARVARIDMPAAARTDFAAMRPDFAMLQEHEQKLQRLAGRFGDGDGTTLVVPVDAEVRNVMGSTAGAGSQDYHEYRHARRQERGRLGAAHAEARQAKAREKWEAEQAARAAEQEHKTAKRAAKRQRQKAAKRASTGAADAAVAPGEDEPAADEAPRVEPPPGAAAAAAAAASDAAAAEADPVGSLRHMPTAEGKWEVHRLTASGEWVLGVG